MKIKAAGLFCYILLLGLISSGAELPPIDESGSEKEYYALIISGVGGDLKQSEKFQSLANELYDLLKNDFGYLSENIIYLAGDARKTDTHVSDRSIKKNITFAVSEFRKKVEPEDQMIVFVVGNADYRNQIAGIHLPREEITPKEFGSLFDDFPGTIVMVITTPVSGSFLPSLSGEDRVVITATKPDTDVNETYFPEAFILAAKELAASKESTGSIAEIYSLAREKTCEYFEELQIIPTEQSMLDDNGDGEGTTKLEEKGDDGSLAADLLLGPRMRDVETAVVEAEVLESGKKWESLRPPAVVLLHDIEYTVHSDLTYRIKERNQIKILNKGGHAYSDIIIFYNTAYETLSVESAVTIKPDGEIDELNPSEILDVSAAETMMYTESRYKRFSMPSVEDGCIIDYTFVKTGKNLHLSRDFWRTFIIENSIPQDELRIAFNIPKTKKITYKFTREELPFRLTKTEEEDPFSRNLSFVMKDIAPLTSEPKSPPVQELSTRLIVTSIPSWDTIWEWYKELSDSSRDSSEEIEALVDEITEGQSADLDKARAIYDWVSNNIRYVGLELGKHGYQPHKATKIFDNKFGDCKDKATLLLSMLDTAGLDGGEMVLIPTNNMAQVDISMPTLDQFNHVIATITIDGKRYWLDTTGGETAFGDIPVSDQNREVFVVGAKSGEFMAVPTQPPIENLLDNQSRLVLDESGTLSGKDIITYTGAFATAFRHKYKYLSAAEQKQAFENVLNNFIPTTKLDHYSIDGIDTLADKIVYEREYSAKEYAPRADDLMILHVPLQKIGMTEIVSSAGRTHPLVIGQTMMRKGRVELHIPDSYGVRNMPKPVNISNDFGSYTEKYIFDVRNKMLRCENSFQLNKIRIGPEEYSEFKRFIDEIAKTQRRLLILIRVSKN